MTRSALILAAVIVTPALAQQPPKAPLMAVDSGRPERRVMPPARYDIPYTGILTVTRVPSEVEVAKLCPQPVNFAYRLGCARQIAPQDIDGVWQKCHIIMIADDILDKASVTAELFMRHELAHCNGWSSDHPNARYAP